MLRILVLGAATHLKIDPEIATYNDYLIHSYFEILYFALTVSSHFGVDNF